MCLVRTKYKKPDFSGGQSACLVALITLFLIGAVVGSFFAANLGPGGQDFVAKFFHAAPILGTGRVLQMAGLETTLLLAIFTSAFFSFGLVAAPLAMGVKGFVLSLLISAFVKTFGLKGYAVALALVMPGGLISVACMVLVGLQAMILASRRAERNTGAGRRGRIPMDKAYYLMGGIALGLMAISAAIAGTVTPLVGRMLGL